VSELRLTFRKQGDDWFVQPQSLPDGAQGVSVPVPSFLTDRDYDDLRWYLEDYMDLPDGGSVTRAEGIEKRLDKWGLRLLDMLFKEADNHALLDSLIKQKPPKLLTVATDNPDCLRIPWELIRNRAGPLVQQGITIRRQLPIAGAAKEHAIDLPLRILLIVSRPSDAGFIDPRLSARSMLDALAVLGDDVCVDFCRPPTLARMTEMLHYAKQSGKPYHIVHFDGHGTFVPAFQLGALLFEQPERDPTQSESKTDLVPANQLGDLFVKYEIPLVVLEACRTGALGQVALFRSVAPRLIEAGVGTVIAMSHAVLVEAANILLERFYRELVKGATVGQALDSGREALVANPYRRLESRPSGRKIKLQDWHLPHLYERGQDEAMVPSNAAERRATQRARTGTEAAKPFDVFLSYQHAQQERVEHIALLLKDRHGLNVWFDKWQVGAGPLREQCRDGVAQSRYVLVACTKAALDSKWVAAEQDWATAGDPQAHNVIPLLLENVKLPADLQALKRVDFRVPTQDTEKTAELAAMIPGAPTSTSGAECRLASRERDEVGSFPPAPIYGFQGRAHELYELERQFRNHRAILLHAMGGMGKTALATEAAFWWTRTGLFPAGACFINFEQFRSAEQIVQMLGTYLEGNDFNARSGKDQTRRLRELFDEKPVLMVWDNFESILPQFQPKDRAILYNDEERNRIHDLFRELTEKDNGQGRLLITCRPGEAGLPGARHTELHGLARPDSLWLLSRVLDTVGVQLSDPRWNRDSLEKLLQTLDDHPLSIELVGPHLKRLTPEEIIADFGKLLTEFKTGKGEERNESLRASLAFSTRRLSKRAQEALPWLGIYSGGVFERLLLDVSGLAPDQWAEVRSELQATALIRVETDVQMNDRPYLRFHPTLSYAAAGHSVPDPAEARERFIKAYLALSLALNQAFFGAQSRAGLEVLAHEEANYRTAVRWAAGDKDYAVASELGWTFRRYLEMSGRLRERDSWVSWLAKEVRQGGFSKAVVGPELDEAWTFFDQGHALEAIQRLQNLIERLNRTTEFAPAFELAAAQAMLGRVLNSSGQSQAAVPVLEQAVKQWESLIARAGENKTEDERANLSAALNDLADSQMSCGLPDEALQNAERGLAINKELGRERDVAAGLIQSALVLAAQGRHAEADVKYDEALEAARRAGDKELEGAALQHQGILAGDLNQLHRAASLYQQALKLFQGMGDEDGVMLTCNSLGAVEQEQGRLTEARSWYERSREIALRRVDASGQAAATHNLGVVCQEEGEAAKKAGREDEARRHFEQARKYLEESLRLKQRLGKKPDETSTLSGLAWVHLSLGDLDEAEKRAHQAREINESLGLKEVYNDYWALADIARARGNEAEAVEWERKRDAATEELERRAGGPDAEAQQFAQAIQALAFACAQAGFGGVKLRSDAKSVLKQLQQSAPPGPDLAAFLTALTKGKLPPVPTSLPVDLQSLLTQLLGAIKQSAPGAEK
jgi:tetratricopeptide (TPR) repeat protein